MSELELKKEEVKNVNEFKGYSLFRDVTQPTLQAWNRCNVLTTITDTHGKGVAEAYADLLTEADRIKMVFMFGYVKQHGWDKVNAEISREVIA